MRLSGTSISVDRAINRPIEKHTQAARFRGGVIAIALLVCSVLAFSGLPGGAAVAAPAPGPVAPVPPPPSDIEEMPGADGAVPVDERDALLGEDWSESDDLAWTTAGDHTGFHVLTARESDGYSWQRVATLRVEGVDTDQWVGNACLTASGNYLAVVYAPRSATNSEYLFSVGGYAAIVSLPDGQVTSLGGGFSLAYFNPGCGSDDLFALTADSPESTRISTFSASSGKQIVNVEVEGQITSSVPIDDRVIAAAAGSLVAIDSAGAVETIQSAQGTPYDLTLTAEGGVVYLTTDGQDASARRLDLAASDDAEEFATGSLQELGLTRDGEGTAHLTGTGFQAEDLPADVVASPGTATNATVSVAGQLAVNTTAVGASQIAKEEPTNDTAVSIGAIALDTGASLQTQVVAPSAGSEVTTQLREHNASQKPQARSNVSTESGSSPISEGSICAVRRNDPSVQAIQPNPAEVEWAVGRAVRGTLGSPQAMFPLPAISGDGTIPPQVMLGILAQESNFQQASKFAVPGVSGNPLVGNYFGADRFSSDADAWWQIDYDSADCGYGIAQVTTGMQHGEMPFTQQLAIATDYQANIARGLQILVEKWNETRDAGLIVNDGASRHLENWFFALWAYNSGFYPYTGSSLGQQWGVGWHNNPINPKYDPARTSFLDKTPADAAHPQDWPYPEKVLGFGAHSVQYLKSVSQGTLGDSFSYGPAFTPSWWTASDGADGKIYRTNVKPPLDTFCDASNECDPNASQAPPGPVSGPANPCTRSDSKCWYHEPVEWKSDCATTCGYPFFTYAATTPKPAASNSYPPNCSASGLPSGALIIDNLPSNTPVKRPGCLPVASKGTFTFDFSPGPNSDYASKIDTHQLGAGFNGQFYFSHTRIEGTDAAFGGALNVAGTWTLNQSLNKWAQVYVHMPSHGAWTQQAHYKISTGTGTTTRVVNQRNYADEWVSLGALKFNGVPSITLDNHSASYFEDALASRLSGVDDIAWDAVAFVPLEQKPSEFIVALGDSYSSGEGTSLGDGSGFFRGSDHHGSDPIHRNACHRSPEAWAYKIDPTGIAGSQNVRQLLDQKSPQLDFHMLACSGAVVDNLLPSASGSKAQNQYAESTQLDRGFLDANTTLVTLSIGGNDVGFAPVIERCITGVPFFEGTCDNFPPTEGDFSTVGEQVDAALAALPGKVTNLLEEIHSKAPAAKVILLGYPTLFETGGLCVGLVDYNRPWMNDVSLRMNRALTKAAHDAGTFVTYESPQYRFAGHNLCTDNSGLRGFMLSATPGDASRLIDIPGQGTVGLSAQSIHPNPYGTDLYAWVANNAVRATRLPVSGSLTAGAPTTYYSTLRWMEGPTAMNVSSFNSCGKELRVGLRTGASGTQSTDTLSWKEPHDLQYFYATGGASPTPDLPANYYAFNARMTTACAGGGNQTWAGDLYR